MRVARRPWQYSFVSMSLKPLVRSVREALDRKDYPYVLQLCTDGLAFEPDNYYLLVFKAMALVNGETAKDVEDGLQAYGKATRVQPENPLAFQAPSNIYVSDCFLMHCISSL